MRADESCRLLGLPVSNIAQRWGGDPTSCRGPSRASTNAVRSLACSVLLVACTSPVSPVGIDPDEASDSGGKADAASQVPDVRCAGEPDAGAEGSFRHFAGSAISFLGSPRHRGIDLIANASSEHQTLAGAISYTVADKALEDEDVELFACRAGAWQRVGRARTDDEGRFSFVLSGGDRLPIGMRDLFVSVIGDRTGTNFLAYVAPDDTRLLVSDVDGTLTSSEQAFWGTIAFGIEPDAQPGAAQAFQGASGRGFQVAYVTARGSQYTRETRAWLADLGFPRGPLRLAPSFITLPGSDTVDYKTTTLAAIAAEVTVVAGVGNRASDLTAYTNAGLDPSAIFIKLPEYESEVRSQLDAGAATALPDYGELGSLLPP